MRRMPRDAWAEWLEAERSGALERADSALGEAFATVLRRSPGAGFEERVVSARRATARVRVSRRSEVWVTAGLLLGALGLTAAPLAVVAGLFVVNPGRVIAALARACVGMAEWLNAGASVWGLLIRAGTAAGQAAVSPTGSILLTAALLVASMALVVLNRYLPAERSS